MNSTEVIMDGVGLNEVFDGEKGWVEDLLAIVDHTVLVKKLSQVV